MIDREFKKEYSGNIILLWIRKFITSLFYFRGYRKLYPDKPWYMPKAVRFIERKISNFKRVFEFGCGDSSIWFAQRVDEYTAVEHDKFWYTRVSDRLKDKNLLNAKLLFIPADENSSEFDWEKEWKYYPVLKHQPNYPKFRHYMSSIEAFPDHHFDCIIIDGRERIGCLLHSLPKLAENGIIIFDDSARDRYQEAFSILSDWCYRSYRFGLGQTTFFTRNKELLNLS